MRSIILIGIAILLLIGAAQAGDLPMIVHDDAHSSTTDEMVETPLEMLWKYQTGDGIDSSPTVSGCILYVGSYGMYVCG